MTKKIILIPMLLGSFMLSNVVLTSCKDKKAAETTETTTTPVAVDTLPTAPVVIEADDPLTKSVADATKDYPGVKTDVKEGVVTLTGEIKRADLKKLMMGLNELHPKKIDNQLVIK